MDFKTQSGQQSQGQSARPAAAPNAAPQGGDGARKLIAVLVSAIVAIVLIVGLFVLWQGMSQKSGSSEADIDTGKYQAVFMSNGQVYFGNLSKLDGGYAELKDVYYLQVQQAVQPAADKKEGEQPKVSLTKLGNELHGPTDEMHISRDQILFWENLKDDSTVVKAIKDFKSKQ